MSVVTLQQRTSTPVLQQQRESILAAVTRLLSHYWIPDLSKEIRKQQGEDWLEDLIEFGPEVVANACREWRRLESRRPTIADIRRLAIEEQARERPPRAPPRPPLPTDLLEHFADKNRVLQETRDREARACLDQCARDRGYADFATIADAWAQDRGYADFAAAIIGERATSLDVMRWSPPGEAQPDATKASSNSLERINPPCLLPEDDPRVQARLREMG